MMDYAGRAAQADTYPKLLRLNAKENGSEIALREKDFGLWRVFTWADYQTRVRDFALGMVELGRALAMEPSLLLLDEPMAGMNLEEKEDMSRFIVEVNRHRGTTIALIEHDMGVVMDLSDRVVVLDYGKKIADGPPDAVKANKDVIDAYLGVAH
jgi:ABC-type branched-subunit amino acid transport system ATPase component